MFEESEVFLKAKHFIDEGYSGRQIYHNLMKGDISHPRFKKYLGNYYKNKRREFSEERDKKILDCYNKHNGVQKYVITEMQISSSTLDNLLLKNNIIKKDNLTGNTHNLRHNIIKPDFFETINS